MLAAHLIQRSNFRRIQLERGLLAAARPFDRPLTIRQVFQLLSHVVVFVVFALHKNRQCLYNLRRVGNFRCGASNIDNRDCPVDFPAAVIRQRNSNDTGADRSVRTFKGGKTFCNLLRIQLERGLLAAGRPNEFRALIFNQAINRILHIMAGLIVALHRYSLYAYKLCRVGNFRRGASNIDNRDCPVDFPAAVIRQRNSNDTGADRSVRTFKGGKTFCNLLRIQLERGLLAAGRPNEFRALIFNQAINRILHIMVGLIVALHRYSLYAYKLRRVGDIGLRLLRVLQVVIVRFCGCCGFFIRVAEFVSGFEIYRENRHRQRAKEHDQRQKRR